jgi:methionyl-tRNA synthetase
MRIGVAWQAQIAATLETLDSSFRLHAVTVRGACAVLRAWSAQPGADLSDPQQAYGWLAGLACVASAVMPRLAFDIWHALGHEGAPMRAALPSATRPRGGLSGREWFAPLTRDSLDACLPPALVADRSAAHA